MPVPHMGLSDPRLMALVGSSVTPTTWHSHGKAWAEWCAMQGGGPLGLDYDILLQTIEYLLSLRQQGCSAVVAQRRLSGVRFHLLLQGRPDVT